MRRFAFCVFVAALASTWNGASALGKDPDERTSSKAELQRLYKDFLTEEGYKPELDSDGDVRFKREGKTYVIIIDAKDPEFFRLVLPNIWEIESEAERVQVLVAADASNAKSKVSKVCTMGDNVWVSIELFVGQPEDFKKVFTRALGALDNGVINFVVKMKESK